MYSRKYRIFDYCWHISHQADMIEALSDSCDFYFCLTTKTHWPSELQKPINLNFVTHYEPGTYDVAILHVDQQVIDKNSLKYRIYREFNSYIKDIPKIVINHGSPVCENDVLSQSPASMQKIYVDALKQIIGNNLMVVNSHTACSSTEWGFGLPVVHGMNPLKWQDLFKEPRVFSALSPKGLDIYYNRRCLDEVKKKLQLNGFKLWHAKDNIQTQKSKAFYQEFLGRSLLYLDTSYRTPMNRARTEAMLCGCCVIQVEGAHDLEKWAKPGHNIIIVPNDPEEIVNQITFFLESGYQKAIQIGQNGKNTAKIFSAPERYRREWLDIFQNLTQF